ncbi:unnamed protein product [Amoebophrya sp. A120]|nr:unnamed protein product [Amoebophrya sp. A120]|eukprot:GSA120T00013508001.1
MGCAAADSAPACRESCRAHLSHSGSISLPWQRLAGSSFDPPPCARSRFPPGSVHRGARLGRPAPALSFEPARPGVARRLERLRPAIVRCLAWWGPAGPQRNFLASVPRPPRRAVVLVFNRPGPFKVRERAARGDKVVFLRPQ